MKLVDVVKQRLSGKMSKYQTVVIEDRTFVLSKSVRLVFKNYDAEQKLPPKSATIHFYNSDDEEIYSQSLDFMGWKDLYFNEVKIHLPDMWVLLEVRND